MNRNPQPVNFIDILSKTYSVDMFIASDPRSVSWCDFAVTDPIIAYAAAYGSSIFAHPDVTVRMYSIGTASPSKGRGKIYVWL
jgi:hypothetical protein